MKRNQPILYIGACTHLLSASHQDAHLARTNLCKQILFSGFGICLMDECNLFPGNALIYQLFADIVVDVEVSNTGFFCGIRKRSRFLVVRSFPAWSGQITENELGKFFCIPITPDADNITHTGIDLTSRVIR